MSYQTELANELKNIHSKPNRDTRIFSAEIKKIDSLSVENWGDAIPIILSMEVVFHGDIKVKKIDVVYYPNETNVPSEIYVSILSDYISRGNNNYNLKINLSNATPENPRYFLENIFIIS